MKIAAAYAASEASENMCREVLTVVELNVCRSNIVEFGFNLDLWILRTMSSIVPGAAIVDLFISFVSRCSHFRM